jgi:predicted DNA-binding transcriptional regulator AlpA
MMSEVRILNLVEAAKLLHMSPATLREKAKCGEVPGSKPAKCWVFIESDLVGALPDCSRL